MFIEFKKAVQDKLSFLIKESVALFEVDIDKDQLWELYLDSFPLGTNENLVIGDMISSPSYGTNLQVVDIIEEEDVKEIIITKQTKDIVYGELISYGT